MKKRESEFTTIFAKYIEKSNMMGYFEIKQTRGDSLSYSSIEEHQYLGLFSAQNAGFRWKISDSDPRQKPFDYIATPPLRSYVVIKWNDVFTIIPIDDIMKEKLSASRKSLTKERALQIAEKVVYM